MPKNEGLDPTFARLVPSTPKDNAMEEIIETYARYAGENHDLSISLTARELEIEEFRVRSIVETVKTRNISMPRSRGWNDIRQKVYGRGLTTLHNVQGGKTIQPRTISVEPAW